MRTTRIRTSVSVIPVPILGTALLLATFLLAPSNAEAIVQSATVTPVGVGNPCYPVNRGGLQTAGMCHEVDVTCGGIGPRRATIIIRRPIVQTGGNIVFFTGELSKDRYSKSPVRRERILEPLLNGGFLTFEVYFETRNYEDPLLPQPTRIPTTRHSPPPRRPTASSTAPMASASTLRAPAKRSCGTSRTCT
jgi:hypothetical protein